MARFANKNLDASALVSNIIAIAAGEYYALALKSDGRLVPCDGTGSFSIPSNARSNIVAIATGYDQRLGNQYQ